MAIAQGGGKVLDFGHIGRARLLAATEAYLRHCYRHGTAARVSEFAAHVQVSRSYLSRTFSEHLGRTVLDVLREKQLEHAEYLLIATRLPVDAIARAAGFGTQMTLYRAFAARRGMTPDAFRQRTMKG